MLLLPISPDLKTIFTYMPHTPEVWGFLPSNGSYFKFLSHFSSVFSGCFIFMVRKLKALRRMLIENYLREWGPWWGVSILTFLVFYSQILTFLTFSKSSLPHFFKILTSSLFQNPHFPHFFKILTFSKSSLSSLFQNPHFLTFSKSSLPHFFKILTSSLFQNPHISLYTFSAALHRSTRWDFKQLYFIYRQ